MSNDKIIIEFSPKEAEILVGAIAHVVPVDKSHEMILVMIYARIKQAYELFLNNQ